NSPAVFPVVGFVPPPNPYAEIEHAVHSRLLATGATGLQWSARIVQPHVHALSQKMSRMHLVIFDERHVTGEFAICGKTVYLVNQMFAMFICRMCLAGKHNLNGLPSIQENLLHAIQILE